MKPTYLLAIETGGAHLSVALGKDNGPLFSLNWHLPMMHSQMIGTMVEKLMKLAELEPSDLNAIAIGSGPGSYTGLRIGVSFAKGLCFGRKIPLIEVSGFDNCKAQVQRVFPEREHICIAFDARRDEVFAELPVSNLSPGVPKGAYKLSELNKDLSEKCPKLVLGGNGAEKIFQHFNQPESWVRMPELEPDARTTLKLGFAKWNNQDFVSASLFEPDYIKPVYVTRPAAAG
jgi:tRNA threonylcarbamoyladenosine biosynthesis protein TsaB